MSLDSLGLATQYARRMQEDGRSCDQADIPAKLMGRLRPVDWREMISPLEGSDAFCLCWANRDTWQTRGGSAAVGMEESYCPVSERNG